MADENSWRTSAFRQSVVAKIDEAIRSSGMNTSRNSLEMESHVFQKAKNKEEYLGFVARLILHVREMTKNTADESLDGVLDKVLSQNPPRLVKSFPLSQVLKAARDADKNLHESIYCSLSQHD
ncbi:unnamed protein product [Acanthoscelides obtectus]|uniref:Mediator of RNA polymerase II transcription subunit 15 n=1 Tax=Acanthoscelides obtectus TaxID=200917 RepID=A0A9P0LAF1_ACAOB|nr:unnamed protein product [Acanthoscelides obtectus]CAK1676388.1 Mediator of RNA polymerase II transcription subunit 15 [Acanthoscelides obtectus]